MVKIPEGLDLEEEIQIDENEIEFVNN